VDSCLGGLKSLLSFLAGRGVGRLQDVTRELLEAYRLKLLADGKTDATVRLYLGVAKHFFKSLAEGGGVFADPAEGLANPMPARALPKVPSVEDVERALAAVDVSTPAGVRDRALLETLYSTATRIGECLRLTVFDLDLAGLAARVRGKGAKERMVPLGRHAALWLERYLVSGRVALFRDAAASVRETRLWIDVNGHPLKAEAFRVSLKNRCEAAGVGRISPHALRRACATHMLRNGAHPAQIQALLGHATLQTLGHYLRLTITDIKKTHGRSKPGR
jgi:site-specific recombinase XerD